MALHTHSFKEVLAQMRMTQVNIVETMACVILLLFSLAYFSKAPPSTNDYKLRDCIPSKGPGPLNKPCQICFELISPPDLSMKHKPCARPFHLTCFTQWTCASIDNLNTPLCPVCLNALLTYEQTLQLFMWRFSQNQKRFFWSLYLNAVACGNTFAITVAAIIVAAMMSFTTASDTLGQYQR